MEVYMMDDRALAAAQKLAGLGLEQATKFFGEDSQLAIASRRQIEFLKKSIESGEKISKLEYLGMAIASMGGKVVRL